MFPLHIGTILLLGIATNLDNLCVGMSYGLAGKRIHWMYNLLIAAISGLIACFACLAAQLVTHSYAWVAQIAGAILLVALGAYTIIDALRKRNASNADEPAVRDIRFKEMLILGAALALNCIGAAFGAGLSNVPALWLGASIAAFSFVSVGLGNVLGKKAQRFCQGVWLEVVGGALLAAIGLWEFFL